MCPRNRRPAGPVHVLAVMAACMVGVRVAGAECVAMDASQAAPPASATPAPAGAPRPEDAVPRELSEAVAARLDELGLTNLLATHLETQLEIAVTDEERAALVARLALLLANRLEGEPDAAVRDELLARSSRVVTRYDDGSEALRLVLLRSQHRAAQRTAEDARAGRTTPQQQAAAADQFAALVKSFAELQRRAEQARQSTEEKISKASGIAAELLAERSSQQEQVARSAQFFRAWALYYRAWLMRELNQQGWDEVAQSSLAAFAQLIEPGRVAVAPADVSVDLRSNEGFASAVLGSALAASLVQTAATADAWLELLDSPGTHESVRTKLPAWRMASLLDRGDLAGALRHLKEEGDGAQGGPMALIAAAYAAKWASEPGAAELLTESVARIAGAGRLTDLAAMTGVAYESGTGAGAGLFEGVRLAAQAQRAQQAGQTEQATQAWTAAAEALERALESNPPEAIAAGARALQGWALRGAEQWVPAADAFEASAQSASGDRAAEALWSAVLCLDRAQRAQDGGARDERIAERLAALVARVAREHSSTAAGTRAHAWRVVNTATPSETDIAALLSTAVPPELAPAARRAAIEGLYRRYRTLEGAERVAAARRALAVADQDLPDPGDNGTLDLRRRLEMGVAVDDRTRAAESLAALEARTARDDRLAAQLADELAARRAQIAALGGSTADALAAAQALDPQAPWGRVAWRAAFEAAERDAACTPAQRADAARGAFAAAKASPKGQESGALIELMAYAQAEAALAATGARAPDLVERGRAATEAVAQARQAHPKRADLALTDAELRWALGDHAGAAEVLRSVLQGLTVATPEWLRAKAMQVRAMAAQDPQRARELLEQVRALAGDFGEGPTGDALRTLDQELPRGGGP